MNCLSFSKIDNIKNNDNGKVFKVEVVIAISVALNVACACE